MSFIDDIKNEAKKEIKKIVLPEATDVRVLNATEKIGREGFAQVVLVGDKEEILKAANENNIDISKADIIEPKKSDKYAQYVNKFYELRKNKGITLEDAKRLMLDPVYYGTMMIKLEDADGLVSGATHSTADTLRPALQIIKTESGSKLVSSFSITEVPNCEFGEEGMFAFSDAGLNQYPTAEELSEIAISAARSFESLTGKKAKVAMLSHSTYGSAKHENVDKVVKATELAKEKAPDIIIDGEMQLDAAIIPEVGQMKAPGSPVAGYANVLIFPNIDAGNIGYKLVERLAKAVQFGPIIQGLAAPVNDLSRGCKSDDVVGVVAITAVQAIQRGKCKMSESKGEER